MPRSRPVTLLLALVALSVFFSPWQRQLFVGDETKYSEVIREMRATGAFFLPTLGGVPFTHKPPLHFWLIDLLTIPFGTYSLWPFVIPSLLAFAGLLWLMTRMARELAPQADPRLAAFLCGSSLLVWASAQTARMDVAFTAFIAAALWMLFRFFERDDFRALTLCALFLAVATLIKGPMAPVIALFVFGFEGWRRRRLPRGNYLPALVTLIVLPLLWFLPAVLLGGSAYAHEVLEKQIAGRAVAAWTHQSGPWFYLVHAPGTLFPWFLLLVVAIVSAWRSGDSGARFSLSWLAAVLLPYSLMSSKLDVYMMALLPPAALLMARLAAPEADGGRSLRYGRLANAITLLLLLALGVAGLVVTPARIKVPEGALVAQPAVRTLCAILAVAALTGLVVALRGRTLGASTLAVGIVPIVAFAYAAVALMPVANELASPLPLIRALSAEAAPPEATALYACPHLWSRDMPPALERVHYASPKDFADPAFRPALVVTARKHQDEIAPALAGMHKSGELRMIGKWFDVYRR
jgi:4-amino-4-deoxy-L-arabinose transferase-like glycosyltransferase